MKTVLLVNLGNRNIKYQGHFYRASHGSSQSFRDWSRGLLEAYPDNADELEICILDSALDRKELSITTAILFYSDTPEAEGRNDQDTLYEAQLLAQLLPRQYPGLEVKLSPLKCIPTDTNALLLRYRNKLKSFRRDYAGANFIILDAGGTPAMKSSLKIICEFMLDPTAYEVYYASLEADGKSKLQRMPPIEYRGIIQAENAISLCAKAEYRAACEILGHDPFAPAPEAAIARVLLLAQARKDLKTKGISERAQNLGGKLPALAFTKLLRQSANEELSEDLEELISPRQAYELSELLRWSRFYYDQGNFSAAILSLHQAFEYYVQAIVEKHYALSFGRKRSEAFNQLIRQIEDEDMVKSRLKFTQKADSQRLREGNLCLLLAAELIEDLDRHQAILAQWKPLLSYGLDQEQQNGVVYLDKLRNEVAHGAYAVGPKDLGKMRSDSSEAIDALLALCQAEDNSIAEMNQEIMDLLPDFYDQ